MNFSATTFIKKQKMAHRSAVFLGFTLYFSCSLVTASEYLSPLQKWRSPDVAGYGGSVATPDIDPLTLPSLDGGNIPTDGIYRGLRAGEFTLKIDGKTLVVDQTTNKVLAVWDSFNVGANAGVKFNQPSTDSVAVNMITDQSPSAILGSVQSSGSLYLLNPNGIIFGEGAQVDTRGLVAAAMELDGFNIDHQFASDAERQDFLDGSLLDGIKDGNAFLVNAQDMVEGSDDLPRIVIKPGASITSDNAPILLAGPEVINEGALQSDQGQVVLAGTRKDLYLAVSDNDADLRGFLVEVDSGDGDERGSVVNAGSIISNLGNVTLVASEILQAGKITSTSSVDSNGSIRIVARDQAEVFTGAQLAESSAQLDALYFDGNGVQGEAGKAGQKRAEIPNVGAVAVGSEAGQIVIAKDSITQVLPQSLAPGFIKSQFDGLSIADKDALRLLDFWHSSETRQLEFLSAYGIDIPTDELPHETATDSLDQSLIQSKVIVEAQNITVEQNALVYAPSGELLVTARDKPLVKKSSRDAASEATISIEESAILDVSGTTDEVVSSDRNTVEVFVTSTEVKDSPFQKGGALLRKRVLVDVVEGTELFDWQSSLESVERSVAERMTRGGSIDLYAEGSMLISDNAVLDASGGYYQVEAGEVVSSLISTSSGFKRLSKADATTTIYDIMNVDGVSASDVKWGERDSFSPFAPFIGVSKQFREGYKVGSDAGSVSLDARNFSLGNIDINLSTVTGEYQRTSAANGGDFLLSSRVALDPLSYVIGESSFIDALIENDAEAFFDQSIFEDTGADRITLSTFGAISIAGDETLALGDGVSLELEANYVDISSDIDSAGGNFIVSTSVFDDPSNSQTSGTRINSEINVSGRWTNDRVDLEKNRSSEIVLDGGNILLNTQVEFGENSLLRSDGGGYFSNEEELVLGRAGVVSIGKVVVETGEQAVHAVNPNVSLIDGTGGGLLRVFDDSIAFIDTVPGVEGASGVDASTIYSVEQFQNDRVNNYEFIARNGSLDIDTTTPLRFDSVSFDLLDTETIKNRSSSRGLNDFATLRKPFDYEVQPVSVGFRAFNSGVSGGTSNPGLLSISETTLISATPGSSLSFSASGKLISEGYVEALSGEVAYLLASQVYDGAPESGADDTGTKQAGTVNNIINLSGSTTDVSSFVYDKEASDLGFSQSALDAGEIRVVAELGYLKADNSAKFIAAGTEYTEKAQGVEGLVTVDRRTSSGSLFVTAESGLNLDAQVSFGDANKTASGGSIAVTMAPNGFSRDELDPVESRALLIGGEALSTTSNDSVDIVVDNSAMNRGLVTQAFLNTQNLQHLSLEAENTSGSTDLPADKQVAVSNITTRADTDLSAVGSISLNTNRLILGNHALALDSDYVQLGRRSSNDAVQQAQGDGPVSGTGVLTVESRLIDLVGNVTTEGLNTTVFSGAEGVRLNGTVASDNSLSPSEWLTTGSMLIESPVLWASSLADYTIDTDRNFSLRNTSTIKSSYDPLSAGATIRLNAKNILLDSSLLAPHGAIELRAEDEIRLSASSVTSVSSDRFVPLGIAQAGSFSWVYSPLGGTPYRFDSEDAFPLERAIRFKSSVFESSEGSEIDVSAGGQVYAREFVPGIEGSFDTLSNMSYNERFALVPSEVSGFASQDAAELTGTGIVPGLKVDIQDNETIPAGSYTVLPASYALLDGAFLVEPTGDAVGVNGQSFIDENLDQNIVARFVQSAAKGDNNWSYFKVYDNERASIFGEYSVLNSSEFDLTSDYLGQPKNNGGVSFDIADAIRLDGTIRSNLDTPTSAYIDITSPNQILVSSSATSNASGLLLNDSIFEAASGSSILVGGIRAQQNSSVELVAGSISPEVVFDDAQLSATELLVAAQNEIKLVNGTKLRSSDDSNSSLAWDINSEVGSLLALSKSSLLFEKESVESIVSYAPISIDSSSSIATGAGLTILDDGSSRIDQQNVQLVDGASLAVYRENIVIGSDASANLDSALLTNVSDLNLSAANRVDVNSDTTVSGDKARFNTSLLSVAENTQFTVETSESLVLSGGSASVSAPSGPLGALTLSSTNIVLDGAKDGSGTQLQLAADNVLVNSQQALKLRGASNVSFSNSAELRSGLTYADEALASLSVTAPGTIVFASNALEENSKSNAGLGARLDVTAGSINVDAHMLFPIGAISLTSTVGDVAFSDAARLNFGGFTFGDRAPEVSSLPSSLFVNSASDIRIDQMSSFVVSDTKGASLDLTLLAEKDLSIGDLSAGDSGAFGSDSDLSISAKRMLINAQDANLDGHLALSALNQQGFSGDLKFSLDRADVLVFSADINASSLSIENNQGGLTVAGALAANDQITLKSFDDLGITEDASLSVDGSGRSLRLASEQGAINVHQNAAVSAPRMNVELMADGTVIGNSSIAFDSVDTVDELSVYLETTRSVNSIDETALDSDIVTANAAVAALNGGVATMISGRSGATESAALLTYSTTGDFTVNAASGQEILEFDALAYDGAPGVLAIEAGGNLHINGSLSAGVINPEVDFSPVSVSEELETPQTIGFIKRTWMYRDDETASLRLSAGTGGAGSIFVADDRFVQTGTGDLDVRATNNLELGDDAYIASVGKLAAVDNDGFAALGSIPYVDLAFSGPFATLLFDRFSGFSTSAGAISVDVGANIVGAANTLASAHLIKVDIDAGEVFPSPRVEFPDLKARVAVLNELSAGVHSVGGGDVTISAGGSVGGLSISSAKTGYEIGTTPSPSNSDEFFEQKGGFIDVGVGGDFGNSSIFAGGGAVAVRVLGDALSIDDRSLTVAQEGGSILASSVGDLSIDSVLNSNVALYRENSFSGNVSSAGLVNKTGFKDYDSSSLITESVAGDILLTRDTGSINALYSGAYSALFNNDGQKERYLVSHDVLPSVVRMAALSGNIGINGSSTNGNVLSLFPSATADLDLYAYDSIFATGQDGAIRGETSNSIAKIQIPDFTSEQALSAELGLSYKDAADFLTTSPIFKPFTTEQEWVNNHSLNLVDRGDITASVVTEIGSIGRSDTVLGFNTPMPITARAGGSIINTAFVIQHADDRDLSSISAVNNIQYPFFRNDSGALIPSANQELGIRIGGPGALVVNAGGSIDLGTSRGIVSRGALDNPNLDSTGAELALAAGYVLPDQYELELDGSSVEDLSAVFEGFMGLDSIDMNSATSVDVLLALVGQFDASDVANTASASEVDPVNLFINRIQLFESNKLEQLGDALFVFDSLSPALQDAIARDLIYESLLFNPQGLPDPSQSRFAEQGSALNPFYWEQLWSLKLLAAASDFSGVSGQAALSREASISELNTSSLVSETSELHSNFGELGAQAKFLVAKDFVIENNVASGQEALNGALSFEAFERGYIAQAKTFGSAYQSGINAIYLKDELLSLEKGNRVSFDNLLQASKDYQSGTLPASDFDQVLGESLEYGQIGIPLNKVADAVVSVSESDDILISEKGESLSSILTGWSKEHSVTLLPVESSSSGDINLLYTTVQTRRGGDITLFAPSGDIDVGQSAAQVESLFVSNPPTEDRLGLLAFDTGSISAISAGEFNVNESRTIPLKGGNVTLWSIAGGIDAGRGAKTAIATPPASYQLSAQTGLITKLSAPAVSGSGISTRDRNESTGPIGSIDDYYSNTRRGNASAYLTTPLGIVDAGEAGIQSAGDLFIAAQEVVGADNISAGGVSAGVPVTTSISSDIGGLGSAVDAATNAVQEGAENAASEAGNQRAAFVTIELL